MQEYLKIIYHNPFFNILVIICILIIIFQKKIYLFVVGHAGEYWTKKELNKLPKDKYTVLNDLLIVFEGTTHQIDHLVISKYGIFVIETKQYHGFITGNKYDKEWVRHYSKDKKIYYENPIRQNYGHVKTICKLLNLNDKQVFNIVCFPGEVTIKVKHDGEIVDTYTINNAILSHKDELIAIPEIYTREILRSNKSDKDTRKKHIEHAQTQKNNSIDKCPKCGGDIILKNGKYGNFYGCSNYPKCRYTSNYKNKKL